jgi:helix-turn-helix protein
MGRDAPVIHQAYRFALAPDAEQQKFLSSCCGASRFWFNRGLALVKDRLDRRAVGEDVRVPWSYKNLCSAFAPLKDEVCPWRSEVVVGSMQAGLEQLGRALQHHSSRRLRQAGTEDLGQVGEDGSHREFGVIGVETLAVKNMLANRRLARHISDVGWGTILAQLKLQDVLVGRLRHCGRRPVPPLVEDVLCLRSSESRAEPVARALASLGCDVITPGVHRAPTRVAGKRPTLRGGPD